MKVFYLVYGLTSGGLERVAINTYKYVDKKKIQIDLITKYNDREFFDDELESLGGKRVPILSKKEKNSIVNKIKLLTNTIKLMKKDYDVGYFNLNSPKEVFKYPLLSKLLGINHVVIHSHNSSEDKGNIIDKFFNSLGKYLIDLIADKKLTCSEKAAIWMFSNKTIVNQDYIQINNGVDIEKFHYDEEKRDLFRERLNLQNKFVVGHIGRFSKQKNHIFIINIFEEILKIKPNSCLVLVGVGELLNDVKEYVNNKNLDEYICFMGAQSNVCDFLQAFDVFLLPSLYEGLPVVGIEAQASGLKCFFSDVITEKVDITGNICFLPLSVSVKEWAKHIVLDTSEFIRNDVSNRVILNNFDVRSSIKVVEKVLLDICKEN